jgi:hypothetical protein
MPEIGLFDAIYSARALRRLKPDPVPDEIIWMPPFERPRLAMHRTGHLSWCAMASNGADWA